MPFLDMIKLYLSAFCRRNRTTSPLIQLEKDTYISEKGQRHGERAREDNSQKDKEEFPVSVMAASSQGCIFILFLFNKSETSTVKFSCSSFFLTSVECELFPLIRSSFELTMSYLPASKRGRRSTMFLCCFAYVVQLASSRG